MIDHTALADFQTCEQYWFDRHHQGLTSATESRAAFCGQAIHKGVEVFYATGDGAAGAAAAFNWYAKAPDFGAENLAKPDFRTAGFAGAVLHVYAKQYAKPPYEVVLNEAYLESVATGECGIIDRVVRRLADGLLYVLDLKTSAWAANASYWRQWHHSQQAAIYLDLAEKHLGEAIEGFWCDHVYLSGRKAGPEQGDMVQYGPVTYTPAKRASMRSQRLRWREVMEDLASGRREPLQSTKSCYRFASGCSLLAHCSTDTPAERESMIQRDVAVGSLIHKPWEPGKRDAE